MRRSASEIIRNLEMRIARLERQASNPLKGIERRGETRYLIKRPSSNMHMYLKDQIVSFLESIGKEDKIGNLERYGMEITLVHNQAGEYLEFFFLEVKSGRDTYVRELQDTQVSDITEDFEFTERALLDHLEDEYQSLRDWRIK